MKRLKKAYLVPRFMHSRWFIAGVAVVLFLGGAGVYIWWSQSAWGTYEKKYLSVRQDVDAKLTQAFSLQSDTPSERQRKIDQLASLTADIDETGDSFCRQNVLIGWQGAFGEYKAYKESCETTMATIRIFNDQLKSTINYLQQEQTFAKQLGAVPAQAEVAEGDFEGQLTAWRSVYEGLKSAGTSADFAPVKQAAIGATEGIVRNWEEVIAAHRAKDKARYVKATQTLAAAYDSWQTVASTGTTGVAEVAMKLKEAYGKLR